ncbi:MAG: relaxase/mobilization nuclease domain-containing protein [Bacteroidetes bacterium]|nr:relaxase/mobilization nuclease domain-containing protein [Bacteroidota bacterium]MBU1372840.1 relaxase/mobilization nuclease domain-containing protein [Bacteroidota bacterium]MBU1485569.1 relaxase/mobilization nuclease domain-containing protein [Bacteroidota bacterium]MBU1760844.1 relaxase/mobilization nuclease domain-containing protein [Bacteroidota bacterium]MBU2045475.1 relaxase/mobilization nuclease domain-containing protein [Bacteroidota bacterium]
MIGHVSIGKSAYQCISYCLEDKRELSEEQKEKLSKAEQLQHQNRAEVLHYNQCFGNKKELAAQFRDVQKLSRRCEKPVLHLSLRLAPGESLSKEQLTEMGKACAEEFGVGDHQYICVLHKDTKEQHIHIAANRVGFDGKAAKDGNSYKRMSSLCRRMEKQYGLQEVLSPRAFLSPKDRRIQRHDSRKERMRNDIRKTLEKVESYPSFEKQLQSLGYQIIKGRGISFIDNKKVKVKGSDLGFSLSKIEKVLELKRQLRQEKQKSQQRQPEQKIQYLQPSKHQHETHDEMEMIEVLERQISKLLNELIRPEYGTDGVNTELIRESKRKKNKSYRKMSR